MDINTGSAATSTAGSNDCYDMAGWGGVIVVYTGAPSTGTVLSVRHIVYTEGPPALTVNSISDTGARSQSQPSIIAAAARANQQTGGWYTSYIKPAYDVMAPYATKENARALYQAYRAYRGGAGLLTM